MVIFSKQKLEKYIPYGLLFFPVGFFIVLLFPMRRMFAGGDVLLQFYPYAAYLHRALQDGTSFIFSNAILGGFPLGATMTGGFFHPLHLFIFRFLDFFSGYHILAIFYFAAGIFFMFLFLRTLQLSPYASVFGALVFGLNQFSLSWFSILPNAQVLFILPLLFYAVLHLRETRWAFILVIVVFAWGFIAIAPQMIVITVCLGGVFSFFLDIKNRLGTGLQIFKKSTRYLLAGIIGILIASPYLLFAQTYSALSNRPELSFAEYANGMALPTVFLRYIFSHLELPYFVSAESISMGFIAFFLALFGFWYAYKSSAMVKFFGGVVLFMVLAALKYSPVAILFHYLPVFKLFRGPIRFVYVANFALAVLAAYGFFMLEKGEYSTKFIRWIKSFGYIWGIVGVFAVIFTLIAHFFREKLLVYFFSYFDTHLYQKTTLLPLEHYHRIIEDRYLGVVLDTFSFVSMPFVLTFFGAILGLLLLGAILRSKVYRVPLLFVLIFAVSVELLAGYFFTTPLITRAAFKEPSHVKLLKNIPTDNLIPYRVFSLWPVAESYRNLVARYPAATQHSPQK